jgi:hypothetical protein
MLHARPEFFVLFQTRMSSMRQHGKVQSIRTEADSESKLACQRLTYFLNDRAGGAVTKVLVQ